MYICLRVCVLVRIEHTKFGVFQWPDDDVFHMTVILQMNIMHKIVQSICIIDIYTIYDIRFHPDLRQNITLRLLAGPAHKYIYIYMHAYEMCFIILLVYLHSLKLFALLILHSIFYYSLLRTLAFHRYA